MEMNELATEVFTQAIKHQLDDIHLLPVGEEYVFYLRDVNGLKFVITDNLSSIIWSFEISKVKEPLCGLRLSPTSIPA